MELMEQKLFNLTYDLSLDLMSTNWIIEKVKDDIYAQHLYAALCNNEFVKNEMLPILREEFWHCSWRSAGSIISDMRNEGDYIDWYCSGIRDGTEEEPIKSYLSEGTVSDEIRNDLRKLGWVILDK